MGMRGRRIRNNWGRCKNGSFSLGCGAQETFKACADISITDRIVTLSNPTKTIGQPSNVKPVTVNQPTTVTKPTKTTKPNRFKTTTSIKPTSTASPSVNKNKNKKNPPLPRPTIVKGETFQEALDRIRKDPRLRWMLQGRKPS
ncbi:hypothetical protein AVEN_111651-1 [Araneus ventricosus]|uniref:Uncharacterized protein n=1 Tax=Araneus ventricosus TaxID=182803 RepID=A0A4Y2C260_ARAVE|nr:hypothetical protein AVEN_111651-1 [Araneus ventricosus]